MNQLNYNLAADLFSKYRTVLMGIGTLGVVLGHNLRWCDWPIFMSIPSRAISAMVFTEGFLFLSGFGLFFSFDNNNNVKSFLTKRFNRLYLPFLLILFPFSVINLLLGYTSWSTVIIDATCIPWFLGLGGYWYVALSLLLYTIYPIVHSIIFKNKKTILLKWGVLITLLCIIIIVTQKLFPDYFSKVEIGMVKTPMFFAGMLCGYFAKNKTYISYYFPIVIIAVLITFVWRFLNHNVVSEGFSGCLLRLLCMGSLCSLFDYLNQIKRGHYLFVLTSWLGKFSLEIYLLHMIIYRLLINIVNTLDFEGWEKTMLVSLNIPCAFLLCYPFQEMCQYIVKKK